MSQSLDAIRTKVEEVRRVHGLVEIYGEPGLWCGSSLCNQMVPGSCDALRWAEAALKMAEEHEEFLAVGGWTNPWKHRWEALLASIAEGLK